jgi:hypothetical protein
MGSVERRKRVAARDGQVRAAEARWRQEQHCAATLRHAHRIASDLQREWTRDELMRLEPTDVLAGDPVSDRR